MAHEKAIRGKKRKTHWLFTLRDWLFSAGVFASILISIFLMWEPMEVPGILLFAPLVIFALIIFAPMMIVWAWFYEEHEVLGTEWDAIPG